MVFFSFLLFLNLVLKFAIVKCFILRINYVEHRYIITYVVYSYNLLGKV